MYKFEKVLLENYMTPPMITLLLNVYIGSLYTIRYPARTTTTTTDAAQRKPYHPVALILSGVNSITTKVTAPI